MMHIYFF